MQKTKAECPGLLQKQPDIAWKNSAKLGYYLWNFGWLLLACAALGIASLLLSAANYGAEVFRGYFEKPMIVVMNLLLPLSCCLLLYLLIGRQWIAYAVTAFFGLGISIANYLLIQIRNDPLQFSDILCLQEALDITATQHYEWHIGWEVIVSVCVCAAFCVALALLARWSPKFKNRLAILVVTAAVFVPTSILFSNGRVQSVLMKNYDHINTWSTTQIYISRGVLYSFTKSAASTIHSTPDGYQKTQAKQLLEEYPQTDIPAEKRVNVIAIMRESYCDLSDLSYDTDALDMSCYDAYHALAAEGLTGTLITNGFGGNTKDAERCFLTGSYAPLDYRKPANSHVWYLRDQGYTAEGAHPFNGWFYNRSNVNTYLGFETYNFREQVFNELVGEDGIASDGILYDVIWDMFEKSDPDTPYFNFSVTYEGHGPYSYTRNSYGTSFVREGAKTADGYAMENYLGSVNKRDKALTEFVEKLRSSDRPIVLLTFGDHKPTLGADINNYTTAAYLAFGMNMNIASEQGFIDYYSTEYLIWANDAAKQLLGIDLAGKEGPMISPCYLMNVLFDALGWDCGSSYLNAMDDFMEIFPVVSSKGRISIDGSLEQMIPSEYVGDYSNFLYLDYYRKHESK